MENTKCWARYVRVSTEYQEQGGVSLDQQLKAETQFAMREGLPLLEETFIEVGSSKDIAGRPVFSDLIAQVKRGEIAGIIGYSSDRLIRNSVLQQTEIYPLQVEGVLRLAEGEFRDLQTAVGRLNDRVLGAVNEYQRDSLAEKSAKNLAYLKACGSYLGATPYGYRRAAGSRRNDGSSRLDRLEEDPETFPWFQRIEAMVSQGYGRKAILKLLVEADAPPPRRGGKWMEGTLQQLIYRICAANGWPRNAHRRRKRRIPMPAAPSATAHS